MSSIRGVDRTEVARGAHILGDQLRIVAHDAIASDRIAPAASHLIDSFSIGVLVAKHSLNFGKPCLLLAVE